MGGDVGWRRCFTFEGTPRLVITSIPSIPPYLESMRTYSWNPGEQSHIMQQLRMVHESRDRAPSS
jgi:hypothetical protein